MSFLIALIIVAGVILTIDWTVHIAMVQGDRFVYGYAGYDKFKEEFDKIDWTFDEDFSDGVFCGNSYANKDTYSKFFANSIVLNGVGMIINNPISYFMAKHYVRKYIKLNNNKVNYKW